MEHTTKNKADIAVSQVIADLTLKGFDVLLPAVAEHLPFDLVAHKEGKFYRIQVKFSSCGTVSGRTCYTTRKGTTSTKYAVNAFDYYGVYLPDKSVVIYPSIAFAGMKIRTEPSNSSKPFYWYEDFLDFTDKATRKSFHDFDIKLNCSPRNNIRYIHHRKVVWPSPEELQTLVQQKPLREIGAMFGVSDKTVAKWAKRYGTVLPPHGYWIKKKNG